VDDPLHQKRMRRKTVASFGRHRMHPLVVELIPYYPTLVAMPFTIPFLAHASFSLLLLAYIVIFASRSLHYSLEHFHTLLNRYPGLATISSFSYDTVAVFHGESQDVPDVLGTIGMFSLRRPFK